VTNPTEFHAAKQRAEARTAALRGEAARLEAQARDLERAIDMLQVWVACEPS
jgi:hypothetical protein